MVSNPQIVQCCCYSEVPSGHRKNLRNIFAVFLIQGLAQAEGLSGGGVGCNGAHHREKHVFFIKENGRKPVGLGGQMPFFAPTPALPIHPFVDHRK